MTFEYFERENNHPLIAHFFKLSISNNAKPFKSVIVPVGETSITYVFCDVPQTSIQNNKKSSYKDLVLTGQTYGCYHVEIHEKSLNIGFSLKPTALYKILNEDITKFNNGHFDLKKANTKLFNLLSYIFISNKDNQENLVKSVYKVFDKWKLSKDKDIVHIDKAIAIIEEKNGLLNVYDLLKEIPLSQKSLEVKFKKIVGLTPGKYIRQHRFIKLMRKYESKKIEISKLLKMFEYYDSSHFSKDFKLFFGESPKTYFKNEYPLISNYLKE